MSSIKYITLNKNTTANLKYLPIIFNHINSIFKHLSSISNNLLTSKKISLHLICKLYEMGAYLNINQSSSFRNHLLSIQVVKIKKI